MTPTHWGYNLPNHSLNMNTSSDIKLLAKLPATALFCIYLRAFSLGLLRLASRPPSAAILSSLSLAGLLILLDAKLGLHRGPAIISARLVLTDPMVGFFLLFPLVMAGAFSAAAKFPLLAQTGRSSLIIAFGFLISLCIAGANLPIENPTHATQESAKLLLDEKLASILRQEGQLRTTDLLLPSRANPPVSDNPLDKSPLRFDRLAEAAIGAPLFVTRPDLGDPYADYLRGQKELQLAMHFEFIHKERIKDMDGLLGDIFIADIVAFFTAITLLIFDAAGAAILGKSKPKLPQAVHARLRKSPLQAIRSTAHAIAAMSTKLYTAVSSSALAASSWLLRAPMRALRAASHSLVQIAIPDDAARAALERKIIDSESKKPEQTQNPRKHSL